MSARSLPARALALFGTASVAALLLVGCVAQPTPVPTSTGDPSPDPSTATPDPSHSASPEASADIEMPASCEDIYSAGMLALLEEQNPPLNDPGVTMHATQVVTALEIIESGAPTLRCSWGVPSEVGLATNVTVVDASQAALVREALSTEGFTCADDEAGTRCARSGEDEIAAFGETHHLHGNGWVATRWINFDPPGYTDDVVATLWG
ncbi:hypothetical protein ACIGCK_09930 [Microbacterium sp. NPDC078428]|uniref:Uncharacterized protein n=1 Tax=Microbacterium limosum TaxID=3079935 RepID=A0AAU0ME00_9MICO|nr:hypothetical protein [Microbacterium sp. Y20]WOQ68661.1 hypothetical protein RYJ27_07990 [Microbacterium sp. Y20]